MDWIIKISCSEVVGGGSESTKQFQYLSDLLDSFLIYYATSNEDTTNTQDDYIKELNAIRNFLIGDELTLSIYREFSQYVDLSNCVERFKQVMTWDHFQELIIVLLDLNRLIRNYITNPYLLNLIVEVTNVELVLSIIMKMFQNLSLVELYEIESIFNDLLDSINEHPCLEEWSADNVVASNESKGVIAKMIMKFAKKIPNAIQHVFKKPTGQLDQIQ